MRSERRGLAYFGAGSPKRPETPVVRPSKKMSQWNPLGFFSGNSVP